MAEDAPHWPRQFYQGPSGNPFLFYVVCGAFSKSPALSRQEYRSNGLFPGLKLAHFDERKHPDVLSGFRQGYLWDNLQRRDPVLTEAVQGAGECLILKGELQDQTDLNYLRDTVGLLAFLLDHGGNSIYDPQMLHWWDPAEWRDRVFRPAAAVPLHHAVILTSPEEEDDSLTWFHTRGMRKFGRPDLSLHRVAPKHREAVIELCNRFIEFQAFGGVIDEGQPIRMKSLPRGLTCHHAGDLDDPDFNNFHVEITPPLDQ